MTVGYVAGLEETIARDETALQRIRQLHTPVVEAHDWPVCVECGHAFPCPTYQAIEPEAVA